MTTHPDSPEPTPERTPMSEERMDHLRARAAAIVDSPRTNWGREHAVAALECLDEIERQRAVIAERDAELVIWRAGNDRRAGEALAALMKELDSFNAENPWLGICAAVVLLKMDQTRLRDWHRMIDMDLDAAERGCWSQKALEGAPIPDEWATYFKDNEVPNGR